MVFTLKHGITFWDGKPLTPDDVVYSLERNTDPKLAGFYGASSSTSRRSRPPAPNEVTIKLKQPDYWLQGELASIPASCEKALRRVRRARTSARPPAARCAPARTSSAPGSPATCSQVVKNDDLLGPGVKPLVGSIDFKGAPDEATLTSALLTGEIDGSYAALLSTLDQLKPDSASP